MNALYSNRKIRIWSMVVGAFEDYLIRSNSC